LKKKGGKSKCSLRIKLQQNWSSEVTEGGEGGGLGARPKYQKNEKNRLRGFLVKKGESTGGGKMTRGKLEKNVRKKEKRLLTLLARGALKTKRGEGRYLASDRCKGQTRGVAKENGGRFKRERDETKEDMSKEKKLRLSGRLF